MSKIYTKTQREPYLVTKNVAEQIKRDYDDVKISPGFPMEIRHVEGIKLITKADIRSIDISFSDNDYWTKKRELEPPKPYVPEYKQLTPDEEKASREAMITAKKKLIEAGIIRG